MNKWYCGILALLINQSSHVFNYASSSVIHFTQQQSTNNPITIPNISKQFYISLVPQPIIVMVIVTQYITMFNTPHTVWLVIFVGSNFRGFHGSSYPYAYKLYAMKI